MHLAILKICCFVFYSAKIQNGVNEILLGILYCINIFYFPLNHRIVMLTNF